MATTLMVGAKSCKTSHTTTWKEVDVRFSNKIDAESQKQNPHVSKLMEELPRICRNSQTTPIMLKARNIIHLSELMHELAKTCKSFQATPRKSKVKAIFFEKDTKAITTSK
jgi:hypothetical protein